MKSNSTLIVTIVLVLVAGAYWYISSGTDTEAPLIISTSENPQQTEFKMLINKLPSSFNTAIFSDPRFNALVDLTTQIAPESPGRLDPFAPITGINTK